MELEHWVIMGFQGADGGGRTFQGRWVEIRSRTTESRVRESFWWYSQQIDLTGGTTGRMSVKRKERALWHSRLNHYHPCQSVIWVLGTPLQIQLPTKAFGKATSNDLVDGRLSSIGENRMELLDPSFSLVQIWWLRPFWKWISRWTLSLSLTLPLPPFLSVSLPLSVYPSSLSSSLSNKWIIQTTNKQTNKSLQKKGKVLN